MDALHVAPLGSRSPLLSALAVLLLPLLIFYVAWHHLLYPLLFSPLRHIPPAHPLASVSSVWIHSVRHRFRENRTLYDAHKRLGSVVRLSPNEVSVNCLDHGLRTIYAGGFEKPDWYPNLFTNYDGVQVMFATKESHLHSNRKRMLSNVYAKSYLQSSPAMALVATSVIYRRLLPLLQVKERMGATVNVRRIVESTTMDIVTGYLFGLRAASNFVKNPEEAEWWLTRYQSRKAFTFWPQEMPRFTSLCSMFGIRLSPKWVAAANHDLEAWCLRHCDDAEDVLLQSEKAQPDRPASEADYPVVYSQLRTQLQRESQKPLATPLSAAPHRLQIASEMLDHLSAGHETSAITLTFLFYELSLRPSLQKRLRAELQTLSPPIIIPATSNSVNELPAAKSVDALPLLHSVLMETLRLHAAIPGPQPRETPLPKSPTDSRLGPYAQIPARIRVSANAHCLHRNEEVFPNPGAWIPERWLNAYLSPHLITRIAQLRHTAVNEQAEEERLKEMGKWFWAFGSGGRMCIGSNLAMLQMKWIVAAVISCFRVELAGLDGIDSKPDLYDGCWVDCSGEGEANERKLIDDAPMLEQEDIYTAQPLAKDVSMRFERWQEGGEELQDDESDG